MHQNSLLTFKTYGLPHIKAGDSVLEVGPSDAELRDLMAVKDYSVADIVSRNWACPNLLMPDEYTLPTSRLYDVVVATNVAEHVRKIWRWVKAMRYALKQGGKLILVSPISWPYHEWPVDCWRIYPEGYKALFEDAGLEHVFSWHGNLVPIEPKREAEHGPGKPIDCIAVGRKP